MYVQIGINSLLSDALLELEASRAVLKFKLFGGVFSTEMPC